MSQAIIWTGSADFIQGTSTPFGIYDSDSIFQSDAPKVASKLPSVHLIEI